MLNIITDYLNIWTSSIKYNSTTGRSKSNKIGLHGIQKLRELILDLAVRGKLVPQDIHDEPASVLLKKIENEKSKLIKIGHIKKQRIFHKISDDEKPFEIPQSWCWVRLGEIGNIFNGNSINSRLKEERYMGIDGIPYIATKDVSYGFESLNYENGVSIPIGEPKFKVAHKGSVLMCAEGGSAGRKCGIVDRDICFGNKLFANELYGEIYSEYILAVYLSPTFYSLFSKSMTGIIGGISSSKFADLPIPLAPLSEQNRIVSKLNELLTLCLELEQHTEKNMETHNILVETLLSNLSESDNETVFSKIWNTISHNFGILITTEESIDMLKKCILELATSGKIIRFQDGVQKKDISKLLSFGPRNGYSPKEVAYKTKFRVLKLGATSKGFLNLNESKYVDIDIEQTSHLCLQKGDILIQRGNAANYVGCNLLINTDLPSFIYPDLMMKIRTNNKVLPEYLSFALAAPSNRKTMWSQMTGTSGTMPKISKKVVENISIWVPDLPIQRLVVKKVDELIALCDQLKERLSYSQSIQNNLANAIVERKVS